MTDREHRKEAEKFSKIWKGRGSEKSECQVFWLSLLRDVFGVDRSEELIKFEERTHIDRTSFIDARIPSAKVLIEQKSIGKNLHAGIPQSDGHSLTPFGQARRYIAELPVSKHPRWVVLSNFEEFHIYDMDRPERPPEVVCLANLKNEWHRLRFLVDGYKKDVTISKQTEVSVQAGRLIGVLYDILRQSYDDPEADDALKSLNRLCVRLVFCLYAEDCGIFSERNQFHDHLVAYRNRPADFRKELKSLFEVLDTPLEKRDRYLDPALAAFPYVNGGLFAGEVEVPFLSQEFIDALLDKASMGFDWSPISPTIFGAMFESTLNPETRHDGGMHYTSIENIHKVIDSLFLDELAKELHDITAILSKKQREVQLRRYREKLASLSFLDPACGSGNFLTETYMSLRHLENEALRVELKDQRVMDANIIKVNPSNFHGIEINDFAVSVAQTALWIAESQMMAETADILDQDLDFLPLKHYENIVEANALTTDWNETIGHKQLDYIIGNPPFIGARVMSKEQKDALTAVLGKEWPNSGNLDFVAGWYKKCADIMKGTSIKAALVSTNSICQGEQVAPLWKPLLNQGLHIDFAYRTFRWDSESSTKAHVHCVIVGFSFTHSARLKRLYAEDGTCSEVGNISPYLVEGPEIVVESRSRPLCPSPKIGIGNQPIDDSNYLFTFEGMKQFIDKEPESEKYFHPWYGAKEFINRKPRYCLWLGECSPHELRSMAYCLKIVQSVRAFRQQSTRKSTVKLADKPTRFQVENMPVSEYLLIPIHSSSGRNYIPIGFMSGNVLASNAALIVSNASLYHFGVLTSAVHMIWMRLTAGYIKSDYRYSKDVVYNNFPWPKPTEKQRKAISDAAQAILDARSLFDDCSYADLYDDAAMPIELRKAHCLCDEAVFEAYGFASSFSEIEIASRLLARYAKLSGQAK